MFSHPTKESKDSRVEINDISANTMEKILHFLYTGNVTNEVIDKELFIAADKYQIIRLKAICEYNLVKHLNITNALELAVSANMCGSEVFQNEMIKFHAKYWKEMNSSWKSETSRNHPDLMVKILNEVTNSI